jgi:hypothetical protein
VAERYRHRVQKTKIQNMTKFIETKGEWIFVRWTEVLPLIKENSFGVVDAKEASEVHFELGICESEERGYFELDGGEDWYAEGSIHLDGKMVVGYDGCFELPSAIETELENLGYDLSEL